MTLYNLSRLRKILFLKLANLPMPGSKRYLFLKLAGIRFTELKPKVYIGKNVTFDSIFPENICIGNHTLITTGSLILTHFYNPDTHSFEYGNIEIGDHVFIGARSIICKPVKIGSGAVIGAGAVLTKNVGDNEIWGGVPARCLRKKE